MPTHFFFASATSVFCFAISLVERVGSDLLTRPCVHAVSKYKSINYTNK